MAAPLLTVPVGGKSRRQSSAMSFRVTGPDRIGFWWRMGNDSVYLYFSVDGSTVQSLSGAGDGGTCSLISDQASTVQWTYYQYGDLAAGTPTAWVDRGATGVPA